MKILKVFFRYVFLIIILLITFLYINQIYNSLLYKKIYYNQPFVKGIIMYFIIFALFIRGKFFVWDTLEHEMTHALFAFLTLNSVDAIFASKEGGEMQYSGKKGKNILITLSPYFFPTVLIFLLLLKFIIAQDFYKYFDFVMGFVFGYYIFSTIKEAHFHQPDLHVFGLIFSYLFIIALNILILGSIFIYEIFGQKTILMIWKQMLNVLSNILTDFFIKR